MNLLAIDTSGPVCGVAVMKNGVVCSEHMVQNRLTHSVNLLPMIDAALEAAGLGLDALDRIGVVTGPGSFTGVRLGVSTVKGLAHGCGKPVAAVNALEAMAMGVGSFDGVICPIQDARAGQVYGAAFRAQNGQLIRLMPDEPLALSLFIEKISAMGDRFLFLGDGMPVQREALTRLMGERAVFAPPHLAYLRPASVAVLAAQAEQLMDYRELMPLYLRAPSAERNKKLMEAAREQQ